MAGPGGRGQQSDGPWQAGLLSALMIANFLGIICLFDSLFRAGLAGQEQAQALPTGPPARGDRWAMRLLSLPSWEPPC